MTDARPDAAPDMAAPEAGPPAPIAGFLARLDADKRAADIAETRFQREAAEKAKALSTLRAHAYRRADLMAALAEAVLSAEQTAEGDALAVAAGQALLRGRLGWTSDSDARTEVLERFAALAVAVHAAACAPARDAAAEGQDADAPAAAGADPAQALAAFEEWYLASRQTPFWYLFEHYMPETPLVDF